MALIEDLYVQQLRNARLFFKSLNPISSSNSLISGVTSSIKYGITLALGPENQIFSCISTAIQNGVNPLTPSKIRLINYPDAEAEISFLEISGDGTILAVGLNTTNGAFIDLFDVQCFDVKSTKEIFPLAKILLSNNNSSKCVSFSWNPCNETHIFAASASDGTLLTVQYELQNGLSFSMIASQIMKSSIFCISWSPKGKQLTVGDINGRIHQLKPDLVSVRVIEPPKEAPPGFQSGESLMCADICWLSTTEWLVGYSNNQKSRFSVGLLVVKKQQPPTWTFFKEAIEPNVNINMPLTLNFCPLLDWQLVFVCSSVSSKCSIIGFRNNSWCHFKSAVLLPLEDVSTGIYPIGCSIDLAFNLPVSIGGQNIPPQPLLNILSASGWLISYHLVSVIPRINLVKCPENINIDNAKFGNPPAGYKPRPPPSSVSTITTNTISQQNPIKQEITNNSVINEEKIKQERQKAEVKPFSDAKTKTDEAAREEAEKKAKVEALEAERKAKFEAEEAEKKAKIEALEAEKKAKLEAEEAEKKENERLEAKLFEQINVYCAARNELTKKIDLLREISGEAGDSLINLRTFNVLFLNALEKFDDTSSILREIQISVDDSIFSLEHYRNKIFESEDLIKKLNLLYEEKKKISDKKNELDFNQLKSLELSEDRYQKTIEKFENMKKVLNTVLSKKPKQPTQQKSLNNAQDDIFMYQKKIASTSKTIALGIVRLSSKMSILQKQFNQLKLVTSKEKNINIEKLKELEKCHEFTDQCTMPIKRLFTVTEVTRAESRALWNSLDLVVDTECHLKLYNLFKNHKPIYKKFTQEMLTSDLHTKDVSSITKKNDADAILNKIKNNSAIQKPKLVSVGTQSPKFKLDVLRQTKQPIKQVSNYSTPVSTIETKSPMFLETPKTTNIKSNINCASQTQDVVLATDITKKDSSSLSNLLFSDNNITPVISTTKSSKLFNQQISTSQSTVSPPAKDIPLSIPDPKSSVTNSLFEFKPVTITTTSTITTTIDIKNTKTTLDSISKNVISSPEFFFKPTTTTVTTFGSTVSSNIVSTIATTTTTATTTTQSVITPISSTTTSTLNNAPTSLNFLFKPATSIVPNVTSNTTPNVMQSSLFSSNLSVSNVTLSNNTNTTSKINFMFKPPSDMQSKNSSSQHVQNDVGMEDDIVNNVSTNSVTFEFNTAGLGGGGLTASNGPGKNPFGGVFDNKSSNTSWLFSGTSNVTSNQQQGSSIFDKNSSGFTNTATTFGGNAFGGSAFSGNNSAFEKSAFGGSPFSSPVSGGSAFGSGPTFGGGSAFRNQPDANSSVFGGKAASPAATSTPIASGFSAFANKSSAFSQLAGNTQQQTSPQQNSSLFGGNVKNAFGGGGGTAQNSSSSMFSGKSSAFTSMRK